MYKHLVRFFDHIIAFRHETNRAGVQINYVEPTNYQEGQPVGHVRVAQQIKTQKELCAQHQSRRVHRPLEQTDLPELLPDQEQPIGDDRPELQLAELVEEVGEEERAEEEDRLFRGGLEDGLRRLEPGQESRKNVVLLRADEAVEASDLLQGRRPHQPLRLVVRLARRHHLLGDRLDLGGGHCAGHSATITETSVRTRELETITLDGCDGRTGDNPGPVPARRNCLNTLRNLIKTRDYAIGRTLCLCLDSVVTDKRDDLFNWNRSEPVAKHNDRNICLVE
jgi:hypothetical protein